MGNKATYMLRYVLPPWNSGKRTEELVRYCKETGIDEVMFFTMGSNFMELESSEESKAYAEVLRPAMEMLRNEGIETSINVTCTIGHGDLGRDLRRKFPFQFQVGEDGKESKACACPLDKAWKEYVAELYRIYSSLRPKIIWVDDDFRLHNHGSISWGCFCPLHLEAFSKRIGRSLGREDVVRAVLAPSSKPSEERKAWLGLMGDTMIDAAATIERAVHRASSETRLGLMTSSPEVHCVEGRRWHELLRALSGPYDPIVRPTLGNYSEVDKRSLLHGLTLTLHTRALVPERTLICPEVENYPYTRFSKSSKFTRLQIALCQLFGISNVTLNLYDFLGGPLNDEPAYGEMLRDNRPFFDSIARLMSAGRVAKGIQLFFHERGALVRRTKGERWDELLAKRPWDFTLPLLGFSVTYGESPICAVSGDSVLALDDDAIQNLLKKGLLLDSSAAAALCMRGMTDLVGVDVGEKISNGIYEELLEEDFGKRKGDPHTLIATPTSGSLYPRLLRKIEPLSGARKISRILGDDWKEVSSGLILFENRLGGRVAVLPHDGQWSGIDDVYFRNWTRQIVLRSTIDWLSKGAIPFFVGGAADVVPIRIDQPDRVILGIANLSSDPITKVKGYVGDFSEKVRSISNIGKDGKEMKLKNEALKRVGEGYVIQASIGIDSLDVGILILYKE